jgi:predicted ATPase/transcriptional regulator with XRE-family HTH domain
VVDERLRRPVFGALLRAKRVAAGLTQDHLAARARISVQAVSALERGARHAPRGDTLALLVEALALDGDELSEFEAAARASIKPKVRATQPLLKAPSQKCAHLPQFATPLFGRDRELREVAAAVASGGCTTLWGTGGVGKTRLAVETSALVEDRFDRIAFVGLAFTIGDDAVEDAIASALGIVREAGDDLSARIAGALCEYRWLVVVDNCEHVIAGAARAVGALAAVAPGTAFVCTSREPLRIAGERVMNVGGLAPDDAKRLFLDRAETPGHASSLSASDARVVATICRKLDGIALALELAAACARVLDLEHVANGLDERFRLLTRGSRAASDRHTTLHATIAWSYNLLASGERRVFERAAIVNGNFSLDDLLAIAVDETCDRMTVLAALTALAEKSLIVVETDGETARRRYRLLESIRDFAIETAIARDGAGALVEAHRRFGRYLSDRLLRSIEAYREGNTSAFRDAPLDQLRGYLDWAIEKRHDVAAGTKLAAAIHFVWDLKGLHLEGLRRIEAGVALLADDDGNAPVAAAAWHAVSRLRHNLRSADSLAPALRAYELSARVGDDIVRADAAIKVALAYDAMGERVKALAFIEEAIVLHDRLGDHASATYAGCTAALIAFKLRGDASTLEAYRLAVERQRQRGAPWRTAYAEMDLAEAYHGFGKTAEAIAMLAPAIARLQETASPNDVGNALNNLGAYLTSTDRFVEAIPIAREALQIGRSGNFTRMIVLAVQTCATIAALADCENETSAQLFGYVARRYDRIGVNEYTETTAHERLRNALRALSPSEVASAIREGEAFDDATAIEAALRCIEGVGAPAPAC